VGASPSPGLWLQLIPTDLAVLVLTSRRSGLERSHGDHVGGIGPSPPLPFPWPGSPRFAPHACCAAVPRCCALFVARRRCWSCLVLMGPARSALLYARRMVRSRQLRQFTFNLCNTSVNWPYHPLPPRCGAGATDAISLDASAPLPRTNPISRSAHDRPHLLELLKTGPPPCQSSACACPSMPCPGVVPGVRAAEVAARKTSPRLLLCGEGCSMAAQPAHRHPLPPA